MTFTPTPVFRAYANRAIAEVVGRPWEPLGRGPDSFDCWGFVHWVYRKAGIQLLDYPYAEGKERADLIFAALESPNWLHVPEASPYAIVTFGNSDACSHVGIYHPNGLFYHCVSCRGVSGDRYAAMRHAFNNINYWYPQ